MAHERRSERPARRGRIDDSGGDVEGGRKLYYHLTAAGRERTRATGTSSSCRAARTSRATTTSPGSTGSCSPSTAEGLIATTGCLGGHVLQALLAGRRRGRRREGRAPAGHLRARQPLRRAAGPRPPRAAPDQPAAARDRRAASAHRCSPPTTATTCTSTTRSPTTRCSACRPSSLMTTPSASSSTATSTTSRPPREMR